MMRDIDTAAFLSQNRQGEFLVHGIVFDQQ
jgi:hypothetical protein